MATVRVQCNKKVTKKMQIVLTKAVPNLGAEGLLTSVRVGYFRNFLLPQGAGARERERGGRRGGRREA